VDMAHVLLDKFISYEQDVKMCDPYNARNLLTG
jgi:hypothetical protein